ncbi:protein-tyrosine-phosphatase MKP1-like [Andrographis paniculata]|uniref:protein-tyrosine-phosphatase MKP1-like n=1 Tax=Andrographis paniculata TaxID=175694 RepID=UPI0021E85B7A|nr:protein-tyrosine-phosphatase MKP1-like [Andrographis paniculata]
MIREEEKDQVSGGSWKYSRSMSWTERPPRKTPAKPQWNSKARACLPPLQPLSIVRPSIEEWPRAGSDDLGIWPNPPTPGARRGSVTPRESSSTDQNSIEFEFRKDKLTFFSKECSKILDHIYLGSDAIAKDREILRRNGITHVLNCVGFSCPEYFKNDLVYKTLWLQDCPTEDITSIFYDVFDYFEDVRLQGGRVFVHCCQGVSRSTSLVIAYLMWKERQSFDDAFQHVKSARGVTNPNVGFACQLLQCQKRVHALPASPTSVLRMYRMAPHSPYDPLHLVPKMLGEPGPDKLDSRGAFIIHIPSAIYVWIGKHCSPVMSDNARAAASQVIRYERAQGPVKIVDEGGETSEFWDALSYSKSSIDGCQVKSSVHLCVDERKVSEYDLDFEIFHGALSGGVVPPFPLSGAGSETCLPARENGWNRLRRKFSLGVVKELITSSKLNPSAVQICDGNEIANDCNEVEDSDEPLIGQCESPDSVSSFVISNPSWTNGNDKEADANLSRSPSFSLVDSFSSFLVNKPNSDTTSPSLSPSTSDISSSFSFSPSSSNWSDVSAQPSPHGLDTGDMDHCKNSLLEEGVVSTGENTSPASKESIPVSKPAGLFLISGEAFPSLPEHRRGNIAPQMRLPSINEAPRISESFGKCLEDDNLKYGAVRHNSVDSTVKIDPSVYKWPSMQKMDISHSILDSRSVYIIHMPAVSSGLYVWIGQEASLKENVAKFDDGLIPAEIIDRDILVDKGFSRDAQIKMIKEGDEPVELLAHLGCVPSNKTSGVQLDQGIK